MGILTAINRTYDEERETLTIFASTRTGISTIAELIERLDVFEEGTVLHVWNIPLEVVRK